MDGNEINDEVVVTVKKEMSVEEKVEALIRAFGDLEEELKQQRRALVQHSHDGKGVASIPMDFNAETTN